MMIMRPPQQLQEHGCTGSRCHRCYDWFEEGVLRFAGDAVLWWADDEPDRRDPRREEGVVCFGDAAVQHDDLDGALDPQCSVVLCAVRARGHRQAHPRQDRCLEEEGDADRRGAAARLSGARPQACHRRQRGETRALYLSPLCRTRLVRLLKAELDARGINSKSWKAPQVGSSATSRSHAMRST